VPVPLAGARERRLLAVLLLAPNQVVPLTHLVDAVWDDAPPASAKRQVQNRLSGLRRRLPGAGGEALLVADGPGYRIRADAEQLDALAFQRLVVRAAELPAEDAAAAAELLRTALAMWRGPALAGLAGRAIETGAAGLDELRLGAVERYADVLLALGRAPAAVAELAGVAAANPTRERLVGQLMVALHRSGRRADALRAYERLRRRLAEDLGVDPSGPLRRLHTAILRDEPSDPAAGPVGPGSAEATAPVVDGSPPVGAAAPARAGRGGPVPRQLPPVTAHFVGREAELADLDRLVAADADADGGGTAGAAVLAGTAGIGKTTLALHWAHRAAGRFPDGQLYANLRGFHPTGPPVTPAEVLRGFLDALAVPPHRVPAAVEAQTALYRSLLADRRVLVVLDNARDAEQVRPLLPGGPGCLALVTSRAALTSLVALDGAHPVALDLLGPAEAHRLLARRVGARRLEAEPAAAEEVVGRCAGLPIALGMVAARGAAHPEFPLAALAAELRDAGARLDALADEDPAGDLRAVFSWSYRALGADAARLFRLLGLHPGPDVGVPAAASLAGLPPERVRPLLAELARAQLLVEHAPGRYGSHDLLRAYAAELARRTDPEPGRRGAERRLLDHYLHTADRADRLLHPAREPVPLDPPAPGVVPESPTDHDAALAWFTAEHAALLAAVEHAAAAGWDAHAWQLASAMWTFLDRRGRWSEQAVIGRRAVAAAGRLADPAARIRTHRNLAYAWTRLGRHADAHVELRHALDLYGGSGDGLGRAHLHRHLSYVCGQQNRHADALDHARQALDLYRAADHRPGQAAMLNGLGWYHAQLGDHEQALAACAQALDLHRELGDRDGQAATLDSLGYVHHRGGRHAEAVLHYRRALELCQELGDRYGEASILRHLGGAHAAAGDTGAARDAWCRALAILDELDHPEAAEVRTALAP
jgi:DNA-binding SARP family transcriptional activator/Flp pilus assembly protein TadD